MKKYWYQFSINYCPLCGREKITKYRVYEKPKPEIKYIIKDVWDYCDAF